MDSDKKKHRVLFGSYDYTVEKAEIQDMDFEKLLDFHKQKSSAMKFYAGEISSKGPFPRCNQKEYYARWVHGCAITIQLIHDEIDKRIENEFGPYLSNILAEMRISDGGKQ